LVLVLMLVLVLVLVLPFRGCCGYFVCALAVGRCPVL